MGADVAGDDQQSLGIRFGLDQVQAGIGFLRIAVDSVGQIAGKIEYTDQSLLPVDRDPALVEPARYDVPGQRRAGFMISLGACADREHQKQAEKSSHIS